MAASIPAPYLINESLCPDWCSLPLTACTHYALFLITLLKFADFHQLLSDIFSFKQIEKSGNDRIKTLCYRFFIF